MVSRRKKARKLISQIHLWLGLASGLVVFVVSLTGAMYAFKTEIDHWWHHDYYFVDNSTQIQQKTEILPFAELQKKADKALGAKSSYAYVYTDGKKNAWFMAQKMGNPDALTLFGAYDYFKMAYLNPYTGKVAAVVDMKTDFFNVIKYLHWSLLLNTKYGQPIVGWGTLIFVVLLITGLVLWWPKRKKKKSIRKAFRIKWNAKWKRLNLDLHNVLGFYSLLFALILAITGLFYSFTTVQKLMYVSAQGSTVQPKTVTKASTDFNAKSKNPIDIALKTVQQKVPKSTRFSVNLNRASKKAPLYVSAYNEKEVYYDRVDFQFDRYSGKELYQQPTSDFNRGKSLVNMNYDIHVGAIGGLPGKVIAFLVSLICASLPVTGFLYWWYRKKFFSKKKKKKTLH